MKTLVDDHYKKVIHCLICSMIYLVKGIIRENENKKEN